MGSDRLAARRQMMIISSTGLLSLGLTVGAIGPVLPELAVRTRADLAALGSLFTALFLGGLLAQLASGVALDRLGRPGRRTVMLAGLVLPGLGVLGATLSSGLPWVLASAFLFGIGTGALVVASHLLVAEAYAPSSSGAMNLMDLFYAVGAVAGPALASLTLRHWGTAAPALWLGGALPALVLPLLGRWRPALPAAAAADTGPGSGRAAPRPALMWALGSLVALYVGVESGVAGWTATYLRASAGMTVAAGALVSSGFWLMLVVGRVAAAWLGARLDGERLLPGALGMATLGGLLLAASSGAPAASVAGVLLLGLGFGPIYPTTVALTGDRLRSARAVSAVVTMGSGGGMLVPWLHGTVLGQWGPRAGAAFVAAGVLAMVLAYGQFRCLARRRPAPASTVRGPA